MSSVLNYSTASFALAVCGSSILVGSFIFQAIQMYKVKTSTGLNLLAWSQNFLGRSLFTLYAGFLATSSVGIPTIIAQGLCGILSVPVIYYIVRNFSSEGKYIKGNFKLETFLMRVGLVSLEIGIMIFALLVRPELNVINIRLTDLEIDIVSIISSVVVSTAFIPQSIKTMKSRNTKNISLPLAAFFMTGNSLLVFSFISAAVEEGEVVKFVFPILMITVAILVMSITFAIKISNIIKKKDSNPFVKIKN